MSKEFEFTIDDSPEDLWEPALAGYVADDSSDVYTLELHNVECGVYHGLHKEVTPEQALTIAAALQGWAQSEIGKRETGLNARDKYHLGQILELRGGAIAKVTAINRDTNNTAGHLYKLETPRMSRWFYADEIELQEEEEIER